MNEIQTGEKVNPQQWWVLIAVSLGTFMCSLDVHIVNLALPTLVEELNSSFAKVAWVPLSYSLVLSLLVLCVARLGDLWNKKSLYLFGLTTFVLSSLACGVAPSIDWLIAARVFQGAGAVFIVVLTPAIVTESFPKEKRTLALGVVASTGWVGVSLGPTAGGVLLEYFGWRTGFLINIPVCSICILLIVFLLPAFVIQPAQKEKFDVLGALLLTIASSSFFIGITSIQDSSFIESLSPYLLLISGISGICFLVSQKLSSSALINLHLFRSLKFSLSLLLSFLVYIFANALMFVLPFFFELVKNYPKPEIGMLVAIFPFLSVCAAPVAGYLADRFSARSVSTIGITLLLVSCLEIAKFSQDMTISGYLLRMLPAGIGFGLFQPPNQSVIISSVPTEYVSTASGLWFFSRTLGQVGGITFVELVLSHLSENRSLKGLSPSSMVASPEVFMLGEQVSFQLISLCLILAFVISGLLWYGSRRQVRELAS